MNNYQLQDINVKGFRSIKDQKIALGAVNVLIGQNGAGKSNFIALFRFLRNVINGDLQLTSHRYTAENLLYYGSKETKEIFIELDLNSNYYRVVLQSNNNDTLFINSEDVGYKIADENNSSYQNIATNDYESQLSESKLQEAKQVYDVLKSWHVYHFHDTSETAGMKKFARLSDSRFLFEDASNIASFLYILKQTQHEYYRRIVKTIQLVIPFFRDFVLESNPLVPENIRLEWNDLYSERTFTAYELSDGSLRFICMATLLLQKNLPKVILLDEPELGLHPSAITILAGLLRKASTRSQVIVSTQSVSLVNEFEAEDIIVVEKKEAETVFRRLDAEKLSSWLEDYSLGDLWDKNVIGGKP